MTEQELYEHCDHALIPLLGQAGFTVHQPGDYLRADAGGEDRILVSRAPGRRGGTDFAVFMSYYPAYMQVVFEMFRHLEEDRGFPCGPYLNPSGVTRHEKYWSYKDDRLAKSLDHVRKCLTDVGLPWLQSLRDPAVYADNVDSVAGLDAALAHEVAGNVKKARALYEDMFSRLQEISHTAEETQFDQEFARPYVFIAKKLGIEREKCEELQRRLSFDLAVEPLGR
jgi:hypothetical protein